MRHGPVSVELAQVLAELIWVHVPQDGDAQPYEFIAAGATPRGFELRDFFIEPLEVLGFEVHQDPLK